MSSNSPRNIGQLEVMRKLGRAALVASLLCVAACGDYPDSVSNRAEIGELDVSVSRIRARDLGDQDIQYLEGLPNLDWIDLDAGWGIFDAEIGDEGVAVLASLDLPKLEGLLLGHNPNITDSALQSLASIARLKMLNLDSCPGLTAEGALELSKLENLEWLCLSSCSGVDVSDLDLSGGFKSLRTLYIDGCMGVDRVTVWEMQRERPELLIHWE